MVIKVTIQSKQFLIKQLQQELMQYPDQLKMRLY